MLLGISEYHTLGLNSVRIPKMLFVLIRHIFTVKNIFHLKLRSSVFKVCHDSLNKSRI
jgi:hypothetical protein